MSSTDEKYNLLFEATAKMLHYQHESEMYHASTDRDNYLRWRRKVREMIATENKERKSQQGKLIG